MRKRTPPVTNVQGLPQFSIVLSLNGSYVVQDALTEECHSTAPSLDNHYCLWVVVPHPYCSSDPCGSSMSSIAVSHSSSTNPFETWTNLLAENETHPEAYAALLHNSLVHGKYMHMGDLRS